MRSWASAVITMLCVIAISFSGAIAIAVGIDAGTYTDPSMGLGLPSMPDLGATGELTFAKLVADDADPEIAQYIRLVVNAAKHKQWRLLVGLLLVGLTWVTRRFGAKKFPWLATDRGGVALHLGLSLSVALASLLLSKMAINSDSITDAITNGLIAAGGYTMLKKLWAPAKPDRVVVAAGDA